MMPPSLVDKRSCNQNLYVQYELKMTCNTELLQSPVLSVCRSASKCITNFMDSFFSLIAMSGSKADTTHETNVNKEANEERPWKQIFFNEPIYIM